MRDTRLCHAKTEHVHRGAARAVAVIAALLSLLSVFLAPVAYSQGNTTNVTYTITIPVVTITTRPLWIVNARFISSDTLQVIASCLASGACPDLQLIVGYNGTVFYNATLSISSCSGECVRVVNVTVPTGAAWVYWSYSNFTGNVTLVYWRAPNTIIRMVLVLAVAGLAMSLAVRSSPRLAAVGLLATSIIVYALAGAGAIPSEAMIVATLMAIGGAIILVALR